MKKVLIFMLAFSLYTDDCLDKDYQSCYELDITFLNDRCKKLGACYDLDLIEQDKLCTQGDFVACAKLGEVYERDEKYKKAIQMHEIACSGEYYESCNDLAFFYQFAHGDTARNIPKAMRLYKLACDHDHARSCDDLGELYNDGFWVARDEAKATNLFDKACRLDKNRCSEVKTKQKPSAKELAARKDACYKEPGECGYLAYLFELLGDFKAVIKTFEDACSRGDFLSCSDLAMLYKNGRIVKKDKQKARKYFEKVCKIMPEHCDSAGINDLLNLYWQDQ